MRVLFLLTEHLKWSLFMGEEMACVVSCKVKLYCCNRSSFAFLYLFYFEFNPINLLL